MVPSAFEQQHMSRETSSSEKPHDFYIHTQTHTKH